MVDPCKSIPSNRQNVAIAPEHPPFSSMFPANYTSISRGFANQSLQLALAAAPLVLAHHAEAARKALRVASGWNAKEFLEVLWDLPWLIYGAYMVNMWIIYG